MYDGGGLRELIMRSRAAPSLFGISVIFGGIAGMSAASLFGIDAGGGFVVGFALLFTILTVAAVISRQVWIVAANDILNRSGSDDMVRKEIKRLEALLGN
jgi:hypothetical protein